MIIFNIIILFAIIAIFLSAEPAQACMTILVGKNASATGEVLVGHNEDAPGKFLMQTHLVKKSIRNPNTKLKLEPDLAELDLPQEPAKLFWSEARTINQKPSASAFCDLFVNSNGVSICSNNCAESREDNPELTDGGIGYGFRRIIAEQAVNASHAVKVASQLIEKYGYASSGRSYAFADKDEIWVMQIVHGKHYAVQKLSDDEVAVIPNHYTIHEPFKNAPGCSELIDYAKKRNWFDGFESNFDFAEVYQDKNSKFLEKNIYRHVRTLEILLDKNLDDLLTKKIPFSVKPVKKIDIATLKKLLRNHFENKTQYNGNSPHFTKPLTVCNGETLESTIIEFRDNPAGIILRRALGEPCLGIYMPWYLGIENLPVGYESMNPDEALKTHFATSESEFDYSEQSEKNIWFKINEIQKSVEADYSEKAPKVRAIIKSVEDRLERELSMMNMQIMPRLETDPENMTAMMEGAVKTWAVSVETGLRHIISEAKIQLPEIKQKFTFDDTLNA